MLGHFPKIANLLVLLSHLFVAHSTAPGDGLHQDFLPHAQLSLFVVGPDLQDREPVALHEIFGRLSEQGLEHIGEQSLLDVFGVFAPRIADLLISLGEEAKG